MKGGDMIHWGFLILVFAVGFGIGFLVREAAKINAILHNIRKGG